MPLMGINRHLVIADTRREGARHRPARLSRAGAGNMERLWAKYDVPFPLGASLPTEWDPLAGARPRHRRDALTGASDYIAEAAEASSATYFVCDFAFGSISHAEAMRSVELFASEIMPAFS